MYRDMILKEGDGKGVLMLLIKPFGYFEKKPGTKDNIIYTSCPAHLSCDMKSSYRMFLPAPLTNTNNIITITVIRILFLAEILVC